MKIEEVKTIANEEEEEEDAPDLEDVDLEALDRTKE
jgi:hypothetical protein